MSPALLNKYLQAAREVGDHMVLTPGGLAFAPHPMLVETDREKYAIKRIVDFYERQPTDYSDYFHAAWRFKHRSVLGKPGATLAAIAADAKVSPKYLPVVWQLLEEIRVGSVDHALRLHLDADPLFQLAAHAGDLVEIDRRTQIRILFRGDQQRCLGEVQFRLRRLQQARERVACLGRRHAHIV